MDVVDKDRGYRRIMDELELIDGSFTKVGVLAETRRATDPKDPDAVADMVLVAAANEFGTARVPKRPFVRTAFDEQRETLARSIIPKAYDAILAGRETVEGALSKFGEYMQGKIQQKIVDIKTPPNAPSTIARKGSSNPLVDTGQMRQSIRHEETIQ